MLFIWKSKLDKMVCITAGDFQDKKKSLICIKSFAIDSNVILSKLIGTDYCRTSETMPLKKNYRKI
jgi:hypothetical protein